MQQDHNKNAADFIGHSWDFGRIAEAQGEVWICFAQSEFNPEILRLAPALPFDAGYSPGVPVKSSLGEVRILVPGVEIALHSLDLAKQPEGESFSIQESSPIVGDALNDAFADIEDKLEHAGQSIESHFHESDQPEAPSISDCELVSFDETRAVLRFQWRPDRLRNYTASHREGTWWLMQNYASEDSIEADRLVPLNFGSSSFAFTPVAAPGTAMSRDESNSLFESFGLRWNAATMRLESAAGGLVADVIRKAAEYASFLVTLMRVGPAAPALAASFSTEPITAATPQYRTTLQWRASEITLSFQPDPTGRRIRFEASAQPSSDLKSGARMWIAFPGFDVAIEPIVLSDAGDLLRGATSVALSWEKFSTGMPSTDVEIRFEQ